ncbi:hypothetical protein ABPG75_001308 [Micractinium tetrahymenae]
MFHFTAACPATAELQDACGIPLGVVVQPLAPPDGGAAPPAPACWAADLARCARCDAYINSLCEVEPTGWACSLCGCANDFASATSLRRYYGADEQRRAALPELCSPVVDTLCPLVAPDPEEGVEEVLALEAQPAVLALVDVCCPEEGLELVRSALAAAVEALPPTARFGLVSFGSQIGLHPVGGGDGGVQHIPLAGGDAARASLQEAAPLGRMLAQVGASKASILAAVEALEVEPTVGGGRERALGDTLRAVLRWIAVGAPAAAAEGAASGDGLQRQPSGESEEQQPAEGPAGRLAPAQGFPGMRLLLFLAGPPNVGAGAVVARRPSAAELAAAEQAAAEKTEQAARELAALVLDPQYPELSAWSDAVSRSASEAQQSAAQAAAAPRASAGDLSHAAPPGVKAEELAVHLAAREFYSEAGAAAAALGVSVDVFAACPHWMGLDLLEPLASASGGSMLLYRSLESAAMAQDVYKSISQPRALACMLRLRCSPELELRGAHGRLAADREHPDLFRTPCCSADDAFAFDLDRSPQPLACAAPAVQLVVQYSVLLPAPAAEGKPADGSRFVLQRRMRVLTAAMPLAESADQLLGSCNTEALACLIAHKALITAAEQGVREARQMLFDWLALVVAAVAERGSVQRQADASLSDLQALHHLPHLVYSLLASPLLREPTAGAAAQPPRQLPGPWQHPDAAAAMRGLLRVLGPDELQVTICPQLASWSNFDQVAGLQHSLSAAALAVGQQPLWVLDSYCQIVVLCTAAAAAAGVGFPPPAHSLLRRTLAGIRSARRATPDLLMLHQGQDDTAPFDSWLLEDAPPAGAAAEQAQQAGQQWPSFVAFLDAVTREAQHLLAEGR